MQQYFLKGFVGAAPEIKQVNGHLVAKFIIAANCGDVDRPKKIWVRCSVWRELAESVVEKVFPGDFVAINGRILDVEAWIDQKTKKAKGALAVHVYEVFKSTTPGKFEKITK